MNVEDKRILVVDDDASILTMVKLFLQKECQVYAVNSAMAAMDFLKKKTVDLIFLDYEMPVIKGARAFQMIRNLEGYEDVPIVFMTGASDRETVMACLALNPFSYIVKPFTYEQLMKVVDDVFGNGEDYEDVCVRSAQLEKAIGLIEDYEVLDAIKILRKLKKYDSEGSARHHHIVAALDALEKYNTNSALMELRKIGTNFDGVVVEQNKH